MSEHNARTVLAARVADILRDQYAPSQVVYGTDEPVGFDSVTDWAEYVADVLLAALELSPERRTLADGMAGISTNYKTGETTTHSRPCTRQSRWVTPWTTDSTPMLGGDPNA